MAFVPWNDASAGSLAAIIGTDGEIAARLGATAAAMIVSEFDVEGAPMPILDEALIRACAYLAELDAVGTVSEQLGDMRRRLRDGDRDPLLASGAAAMLARWRRGICAA